MKVSDQVRVTFRLAEHREQEAALDSACKSVEGTAKHLYPGEASSKRRFKRCVRKYYWLIEPMMGVGVNLVDTRFANVNTIENIYPPDFADLVYHFHRCVHAHGDEISVGFRPTETVHQFDSNWELGPNIVRFPDRVIWALTSVAVFSRANSRFSGQGSPCWLSWGLDRFSIADWWKREAEMKTLAAGWNTQRVEWKELQRLLECDPVTGLTANFLTIAPPPNASVAPLTASAYESGTNERS